jgi:hypothetical protein
MENEISLGALAEQWKLQKELERQNRKERERIEDLMLPRLNATLTRSDCGHVIQQSAKTTRSFDQAKLLAVIPDIPDSLLPVKLEYLTDEAFLNYIDNNEPEVFAKLSGAIVTTTARPVISVKGGRYV